MGISREINLGNERSSSSPNPFFIVKPDGGRYLEELNETLREKGLVINEVYFVEDWEEVARSIYQKQLDSTSRSFYVGFESHIWLCKYLFGNHGLLLLLDTDDEDLDIEVKTQIAQGVRESFRGKFPASNGTFTIAVNLDKFDGEEFSGSGKRRGVLGVMQADSLEPLIEDGSEGVWFRNYFKYIHAPDNTEELIFQYQRLIDLGIMSEGNRIDRNEWELLMFLHCLTPPSRHKISDNL